jgi:hypothetical protein
MSFNMIATAGAIAFWTVGALYVSHIWQKSRADHRSLVSDAIHSKALQRRLTLAGDAQ